MKITIITGSRAEYGLLEPLISRMMLDPSLQTHLIVTGSHLSPEFGMTVNDIMFPIAEKIECVMSSDTATGVSKAMGLAMISFAGAYERIKPDLVIVLGDRYEIMAAVCAAHVARIPIAHIHGGETTEGAIDDAFRHSITHMSRLHFVACEEYRQKVIQLGESPSMVFNVGCLGLEELLKPKQPKRNQLIILFHPETLGKNVDQYIHNVMAIAINKYDKLLCVGSNADHGGQAINKLLSSYAKQHNHIFFYGSVYRKDFLRILNQSIAIVGNSSSGFYEAPALGTATINIGDRQKGRLRANSIIDCDGTRSNIEAAFDKLESDEFPKKLKNIKTPYQGGEVSKKIVEIIKKELA